MVRGRLSFPETVKAVREVIAKHPKATTILIEDKANGSAVIATLRQEIPGLIAVNPEGGKIARAQAISAFVEAGNIYLPHPGLVPWVDSFIEECAAFPRGRNDDQVDQMTQALLKIYTRPPEAPRPPYVPPRRYTADSWME
jgi:predicted phage terminase large subunit-like protein